MKFLSDKKKLSRYSPCSRQVGEEVQLLILDLNTRWGMWSTSRPGRALHQGKGPPVPIGWPSELVWTERLQEKILYLCRGSNPVFQSVVTHYSD
jgi:hypothetical protein